MVDYYLKGEKEFYQFMNALYLDIYNNPETYYIPVTDYDKYMKGRKREELPHKNDSRECMLRNKFQHAIKFYQDFLYEIGKIGDVDMDSFHLVTAKSKFLDMIKRLKIPAKGEEIFTCIDALKSVEFNYKKLNKNIVFFHKGFPLMFFGLSALSKSNNKKYGYMSFLLCDYRSLSDSFEYTFNDAAIVLNKKHKTIAHELNELMKQINTKLKIKPLRSTLLHSYWKLQYTKKGKAVCSMHIDINTLDVFLNFNRVENISAIGYLLSKKSTILLDWFYNHFRTMECSCKNNRKVDIGGKKKRICGLMNRLEILNPDTVDIEKMKKVLNIYHFKNF